MRIRSAVLGCTALVAVVCGVVYVWWQDENRIRAIQPGQTLAVVIDTVGRPSMRYESGGLRDDWPGHRCALVEGGEVLLYSRRLKESVHVFTDSKRTIVECVERVPGGVFY